MVRVRCFVPGCSKLLPQTLVLHASNAACELALEIDRQEYHIRKRNSDLWTALQKLHRARLSIAFRKLNWARLSIACCVCGSHDDSVCVNESWAGTLHSACNHAACEGCLRDWIREDLTRCRAEGIVRVRCFVPGCSKFLPQTLVFHASNAACGLALEIDRQEDQLQKCYQDLSIDWMPSNCTVCNDYCGPTLQCTGCDHKACEGCVG